MIKRLSLPVILLALFLLGGSRLCAEESRWLNAESAFQLLDILDSLAQDNAGYDTLAVKLAEMPMAQREDSLAALAGKNAANRVINRLIDSLYRAEAYRLYFTQFKSLERSTHRDCLLTAPYGRHRSPGGISETFRELCQNRAEARQWLVAVMDSIDLSRCRTRAITWLPDGEYALPPTYFILDGYGDAFAREGSICLDLFSVVLRPRPLQTRFTGLTEADIRVIEQTLAHEFHHIFSGRYLYPEGYSYGEWPQNWINYFTRQFVNEGTAMRCNPPQGFKKEIFEDTGVVRFWIAQLNQKFAAMGAGTITAEEVGDWHGRTVDELPRQLLREYLQRSYPQQDQEQLFREHLVDRPMFIYTLGWWMTSKILDGQRGKEGLCELLNDPDLLYSYYNEAVSHAHPELLVKWSGR